MKTVVSTRYLAGSVLVVLVLLSVATSLLFRQASDPDLSLSLAEAIGGDHAHEEAAAGISYLRATAPIPFTFPQDHGPHNRYKLEWWYFTGNLIGEDRQRFGYQLTFFRTALRPSASIEKRESSWTTDQLYTAHFALTDVSGKQLDAAEKFGRGAAGLAGATAEPLNVWLDDWSVAQVGPDTFPVRLVADADEFKIDLEVRPGKPIVLQGDQGFSRKGRDGDQASYYYSYTRMPTSGEVVVGGNRMAVSGLSWLDREWSTSLLGRTQVGWDWFSIQLDNQVELMLFELREQDSGTEPYRDGAIITADGTKQQLAVDGIGLEVLSTWRNRDGSATYPSKWRLQIPDRLIDLEIVPLVADQELQLSIRYWEGAVSVTGTYDGAEIGGVGYVELTGYASAR